MLCRSVESIGVVVRVVSVGMLVLIVCVHVVCVWVGACVCGVLCDDERRENGNGCDLVAGDDERGREKGERTLWMMRP
jgi:hypothetical protein